MFKYKRKPGRIILAAFLIFTQSAFCVPWPWSAWRYDYTEQFKNFPVAQNLPLEADFPALFVDGVFVHVIIQAHNKTSRSGKPPYRLIASAETRNNNHTRVTFHSITLRSSLGQAHTVLPITVNKAAQKIATLEFPVSATFEYRKYAKASTLNNQYLAASLWADETLNFAPNNNEHIKVIIDIEVHSKDNSARQKIEYEFIPHEDSGFIQCITA